MPVGLTLFGAIFATVGFFATLYGAVLLFVEGRKAKARPKLGLAPGVGDGTLSVWVNWDPGLFNLQIYRLRISHVSPASKVKEGTFTVTFESPQTESFIQPIQLPKSFTDMLEREANEKSLLTFEFRTVDEMSIFLNCQLRKVKKIYQGLQPRMPRITRVLPVQPQDVATVFSLDYEELQARKKRMKDLEAAAKAKAAKAAAAKPAAAPAPAKPAPAPAASSTATAPVPTVAATAPSATTVPAQAVVPSPVAEPKIEVKEAPPVVEDKPAGAKPTAPKSNAPAPAKSVRDLVSASNKNQTE